MLVVNIYGRIVIQGVCVTVEGLPLIFQKLLFVEHVLATCEVAST
jgi:hypothetical protein